MCVPRDVEFRNKRGPCQILGFVHFTWRSTRLKAELRIRCDSDREHRPSGVKQGLQCSPVGASSQTATHASLWRERAAARLVQVTRCDWSKLHLTGDHILQPKRWARSVGRRDGGGIDQTNSNHRSKYIFFIKGNKTDSCLHQGGQMIEATVHARPRVPFEETGF